MELRESPDKFLVRYGDLIASDDTFIGSWISSIHDRWGFGHTFEPESMFYEWSLNRKGSNWRQTWDKAAKRAFHETGATELLMGETDPDWWRQ